MIRPAAQLIITFMICASALGCSKGISVLELEKRSLEGATEVLLEVTNRNAYMDHDSAYHWGDASRYQRYLQHYNVNGLLTYGGIDFEADGAYLAVNDGFMGGLENFIISFWFMPGVDNPKGMENDGGGGVLLCSNWATPNNGDWLIGFSDEGNLAMLIQGDHKELLLKSRADYFEKGKKYDVRVIKANDNVYLYIDDELDDFAAFPGRWPENGAPLSIGGNSYDRGGFGFFRGIIGSARIETLLAN